MSGDLVAEPTITSGNDEVTSENKQDPGVPKNATAVSSISPPPSDSEPVVDVTHSDDNADTNGDLNNDKSGSEAETVVLPDNKEDTAEKKRRIIKHEDQDGELGPVISAEEMDLRERNETKMLVDEGSTVDEGQHTEAMHVNQPATTLEGGASSTLSSTVSSPLHPAQASANVDSDSNLCLPKGGQVPPKEGTSRKRKLTLESHDESGRHRRSKTIANTDTNKTKERRETRSFGHQDAHSDEGSESPPLPKSHRKAHSVHATSVEPQAVQRRRNIPPPLLTGHRRKTSEDPHQESDDSLSSHGPPHLRRLATADVTAMSPAKMPHKKHRDKNGRTWLARACAAGEIENAKQRLQERPDDLNIPDYAGNTPLQIASLEGNADIVKFLLDAGCDLSCKNIDSDTPLIDAAENGHSTVVKLLLEAGADPRQGNAKGEDPLELLDSSEENYDEIKKALLEATKDEKRRRPSDDQVSTVGARDGAQSSRISTRAHDSPPSHGNRSPPPPGPISSRRTARSEVTRNDLLYINPTLENLRDRASKGDYPAVNHILTMRPEADPQSILAAARGGHDEVLQVMLAFGTPEADPDPIRSSAYKPGHNTPMLAAIGRGNVKVIRYLLDQPGFDPTRRLYNGMAYHEIAKQRQSSAWQEEESMLKEAYDKACGRTRPKGLSTSPRKTRDNTTESPKRIRENLISPSTSTAAPSPNASPNDGFAGKKKRPKEPQRSPSPDRSSNFKPRKNSSQKHLRAPDGASRESSVAISDLDTISLAPPATKAKPGRSASDGAAGIAKAADVGKPKRKLVSGKTIKGDQEKKRRASLFSETSSPPNQDRPGPISEPAMPIKVKREESKEHSRMAFGSEDKDHGKKRSRASHSPQLDDAREKKSSSPSKSKKRRFADSPGQSAEPDIDPGHSSGPAKVAKMVATPTPDPLTSNTSPPGAAPVAFMGASITAPGRESVISGLRPSVSPPVPGEDAALQRNIYLQDLQAQRQAEEELLRQQRESEDAQRAIRKQKEESARAEREKAEAEQQRQAKAAREAAELQNRIAREEEETRLEEQRRIEEAENQARKEHEEEEARVERRKRDEELQKRRVEQERMRREEQERRRAEHEERERLLRVQRQEAEERQRREALPNSLRRAAELDPEDAKSPKEVRRWLPLFTVRSEQIDPSCEVEAKDERWIPNFQAAAILAIKDLDLSQYTAWLKRPFTDDQRMSVWRVSRRMLAEAERSPPQFGGERALYHQDLETRQKFFAMERLFWIKLADFYDIVPRYPHLAGVNLQRIERIHLDPLISTASQPPNGNLPQVDGPGSPSTNGVMTNGYH